LAKKFENGAWQSAKSSLSWRMASSGIPPRRRWWYSTSGAIRAGRLVTMAWNRQPSRSSKESWSPVRVRWRRTANHVSQSVTVGRDVPLAASGKPDKRALSEHARHDAAAGCSEMHQEADASM
jgi:hypothetical protein